MQVPILTAKPQLPIVCLSQDAVASYLECAFILLARLKVSEEEDPEEDQ